MSVDERRAYQQQEREFIAEADPELAEVLADEPTCRACGCSQSLACEDGCSWAEADLCSRCADDAAEASA